MDERSKVPPGCKKEAEAKAKVGGMKVSVDTGIKKGAGKLEGGAERGRLKVGEMGRRKRDRRWRE